MSTMHVIAKIPLNYNDLGTAELSDLGQEKYDELIGSRLPDWAYWCGDEILADIDHDSDDLDINQILSDAAEEMLRLDTAEYWAEP